MSGPRILTIMGSGETAPTMAKVHRALFERLGDVPVPAAIIDTPYGFQENADELSARTVEFFATSVGGPWRSRRTGRATSTPSTLATAARPDPRGALRHGRSGQPELRPAAVGRRPDPGRPGRQAGGRAGS